MRIVSLLPSATEIICGIGLRDQLVGITHECDYPSSIADLPVVTCSRIPKGLESREIDTLVRDQLEDDSALYSLNENILKDLSPDLIVSQSLCDVCAVSADDVASFICELDGAQLINLEPTSLDDVLNTIPVVGQAAGVPEQADRYLQNLRQRVASVVDRSLTIEPSMRPKVAILEWLDPLFDGGHWYPELIEMAGGIPCFGEKDKPSCSRSWADLEAADPEVIIVSLCGFDLNRTAQDIPLLVNHKGYAELTAAKNNQVYMVDGNSYFSRPGPRLVDSLEILAHTLHPDLHPLPQGLAAAVQLAD